MTRTVRNSYGLILETFDPAWVREVRPTKGRKMTRYEVIVAGKKVATKYTRTGAEMYARGLNLLMK